MRALLALMAASAFAAEPDPWVVARAPHFAVYSDAGEETARSLAQSFERLHGFFARQLGIVPHSGTVRVIAFATAQEFAQYRTRPGSDAFFLGATGGDYIVMPAGARGDLHVVAHEYAHLLLHSTGWKLPAWIGEGISEVAATVRFSERGATAGGDIPARSQILRQRLWMPLPGLFASNNTDGDLFYSESWAVADLLLFSPSYAPGFPVFLATLATGAKTESALATVYHVTPEILAAGAHARIARHPGPLPIAMPAAAPAEVRVEAANSAALLAGLRGTLALDRGDRDKALAEWKTAIDLGTDDAGVTLRYAVLTEDRAALERTLALDPGRDEARYQLALLEKSEGHMEAVVAHLRKMRPPEAGRAYQYWMALGDALLDLGKRAEAREAFAHGLDAAHSEAERQHATAMDWMARTELAVEFDGKTARTVRVPLADAPARNPFIERNDRAKSVEATLEHVECGDDGLQVKLTAAGAPLTLSVPDPARVQIRNAGGIEFELTCGPQQSRKVLVEYTAAGVLRGLELR
jgi:tetratricopeptide (TPR) repeat protein